MRTSRPYFLAELEVALVVRRYGHDGAGAVIQQDVVGDPDGHALAAEGVDGEVAGEGAVLLDGRRIAGFAGFLLLFDQRGHFRSQALVGLGELLDQRMLGRELQAGGAEDGVDAGGEDRDA